MELYDLYKEGKITFYEYSGRLMEKFDAAIEAAEKHLKEMESKCTNVPVNTNVERSAS